jgi:large subunit ribosomal protein L10e|tara:strand:+ start:322 stop:702 length:381 start_codon:yes stop_codon:yes gene_type:complete
MGSRTKTFKHKLQLVSNQRMQMRDNAIEAARQTCNRLLELEFIANYRFMIHVFPHHILRENPLSAGAGADRMSTGMAHSFGKNIGIAAQVKKGKVIFSVQFNENPEIVKVALKRAAAKLPCKCLIR